MDITDPDAAPAARIATIMVNAADAGRLAEFWAALLGTPVSSCYEQFVWLQPAGPGAPQLAFQQVEQPSEGRRRIWTSTGPIPQRCALSPSRSVPGSSKAMTSAISTGT